VISSPRKPYQTDIKLVMRKIDRIKEINVKFVDEEYPPNLDTLCIRPLQDSRFHDYNHWESLGNLKKNMQSLCKVMDPSCLEQG